MGVVGEYLGVPCCMGLLLSLCHPGEDKWSGWAALRPCACVGPVSRSAGTHVGGAVTYLAGSLPSSWRGKGDLVVCGPGVAVGEKAHGWWHCTGLTLPHRCRAEDKWWGPKRIVHSTPPLHLRGLSVTVSGVECGWSVTYLNISSLLWRGERSV